MLSASIPPQPTTTALCSRGESWTPTATRTLFAYSWAGQLERRWLEGRVGEGGDSDRPEVRFDYDLLVWARTRYSSSPQPAYVNMTRRVRHVSDGAGDETVRSRAYFDGFARVVQMRGQTQDLAFGVSGDDVGLPLAAGSAPTGATAASNPERVVVSEWQVYDDKGRVVTRYEPFFSEGFDFESEQDAARGEKTTMEYDPRGRLVRTQRPDGSAARVVLGVPSALDDPSRYDPTAWRSSRRRERPPTHWTAVTHDQAGARRTLRHPGEPCRRCAWTGGLRGGARKPDEVRLDSHSPQV